MLLETGVTGWDLIGEQTQEFVLFAGCGLPFSGGTRNDHINEHLFGACRGLTERGTNINKLLLIPVDTFETSLPKKHLT
ncbi:hypothetical protein PROFUN_15354 [Planoprotostelium fungivorum]|uniref:Uncharacterized protein n=1 Tax=Planoprotostelium fungivorum TaxID=1890364 RepID=A0A2P6MWT9_9EUKA|nr:hypothetical protein PROFUN_15354 [Planoprotostelium fungivorum]